MLQQYFESEYRLPDLLNSIARSSLPVARWVSVFGAETLIIIPEPIEESTWCLPAFLSVEGFEGGGFDVFMFQFEAHRQQGIKLPSLVSPLSSCSALVPLRKALVHKSDPLKYTTFCLDSCPPAELHSEPSLGETMKYAIQHCTNVQVLELLFERCPLHAWKHSTTVALGDLLTAAVLAGPPQIDLVLQQVGDSKADAEALFAGSFLEISGNSVVHSNGGEQERGIEAPSVENVKHLRDRLRSMAVASVNVEAVGILWNRLLLRACVCCCNRTPAAALGPGTSGPPGGTYRSVSARPDEQVPARVDDDLTSGLISFLLEQSPPLADPNAWMPEYDTSVFAQCYKQCTPVRQLMYLADVGGAVPDVSELACLPVVPRWDCQKELSFLVDRCGLMNTKQESHRSRVLSTLCELLCHSSLDDDDDDRQVAELLRYCVDTLHLSMYESFYATGNRHLASSSTQTVVTDILDLPTFSFDASVSTQSRLVNLFAVVEPPPPDFVSSAAFSGRRVLRSIVRSGELLSAVSNAFGYEAVRTIPNLLLEMMNDDQPLPTAVKFALETLRVPEADDIEKLISLLTRERIGVLASRQDAYVKEYIARQAPRVTFSGVSFRTRHPVYASVDCRTGAVELIEVLSQSAFGHGIDQLSGTITSRKFTDTAFCEGNRLSIDTSAALSIVWTSNRGQRPATLTTTNDVKWSIDGFSEKIAANYDTSDLSLTLVPNPFGGNGDSMVTRLALSSTQPPLFLSP